MFDYHKGSIEVICGPMFAGKTEELIRRINRLKFAKTPYLVFNPKLDNRYSTTNIVSHNKNQEKAHFIVDSHEIFSFLNDTIQVVVIDEAQFFDFSTIDVINNLANQGIRVIVAGLDLDFKGEPFGPMPLILASAEYITKLTAICMKSGLPATRTQRLINGKPANYHDPIILLGATESYEPRHRMFHEVPGKDK